MTTIDRSLRQLRLPTRASTKRIGIRKHLLIAGTSTVIFALYLASASRFWQFTVDDAYISARYALNASMGHGLVFNVHEPVMGYTNLLLVCIETVVYYLGGDGIFWAKLLGLAAGALVLGLTTLLGRQVDADKSPAIGLLAAALLAAYPYMPYSSVFGLETSLFTALCLAAVLLLSDNWLARRWRWKRQATLAGLLTLATLARPEGLGVAAVLALLQLTVIARQHLPGRHSENQQEALSWHTLSWVAFYSLMLAPVLIALTLYYGSPIPNTFWAKTAAGFSLAKYRAGFMYLASWFNHTGFYLLIPLVLWPFLVRKPPRDRHLLIGLSGFFTIYILYSGGDWIPGYRFLVPAMPFYLVLSSAGLVEIWRTLRKDLAHLSIHSQGMLVVMIFIALVAPSIRVNRDLQAYAAERSTGYANAHLYIGEWLHDETPPDATVALMDIGLIGFVSDRYITDIAGLVNKEVATLMHNDYGTISSSPNTAKRIAEVVLSKKPDYIVLTHNSIPGIEPFSSSWSHDAAIYASPAFRQHYRYLYSREHQQDYFLSVYERVD